MNGKPEDYDKLSPKELIDYVELSVDHYFQKMNWSDDDTVLDIGCGTGYKTKNIILAKCPKVNQCVGIDVNRVYIDYAKKNYSDIKITYKIQDIVGRIEIGEFEKYNKVTCFYVSHLIRDYNKLFSNISAMLKPGGYFHFISIVKTPFFSHRCIFNSCEDWKKYFAMEEIIDAEPLTVSWADVETKFKEILPKCDLHLQESKIEKMDIPYLNKNHFSEFYLTTCPKALFEKVDHDFKKNLRKKLTSIFLKEGAREENGRYFIPYEFYSCYGQKKM